MWMLVAIVLHIACGFKTFSRGFVGLLPPLFLAKTA